MCGIVGIRGAASRSEMEWMMEKLRHRGPDAEGSHWSEGGASLGHRRLSIMDPAGGDQPIYSEDRRLAVVANGEIYNFARLRQKLGGTHQFASSSDSEVIVHLFEDDPAGLTRQLDGMFAFALADEDRIYLARDPIGIKPLYYGTRGQTTYFASEIKAFPKAVQNLQEFPPGAWYDSNQGFFTYYEVPEIAVLPGTADEYAARLRTALETAVGKRLMSDVPLGAFLSGGLDSSIIAALARRHMDELHTFSVGVSGSPDLAAARIVARHLDTIHHEYILTADEVARTLPEIIYHLESFDQDLVRSAVPCFFTSRLAADHVKVILTGEGADELFGGYGYYKDIADAALLQKELRRSVATLHNINLQRVDRMTMAHAIEGRVPFLDLAVIRLGQQVPPELKLAGAPPVEKWILRKAFEDLLPPEIVWRAKEQFDEGSGSVSLLEKTFGPEWAEIDLTAYQKRFAGHHLRCAEEALYHRRFCEVFENPERILNTVGRWARRPDVQPPSTTTLN